MPIINNVGCRSPKWRVLRTMLEGARRHVIPIIWLGRTPKFYPSSRARKSPW